MELKVVTWNMAWWSHKSKVQTAWDYLYCELAADVALLTEMGDPMRSGCPYPFFKWQNIGLNNLYWGSGIVSKIPLCDSYIPQNIGALMTAGIQFNGAIPITIISMYCLKDNASNLYVPNLHHYLSDLTPIFNGRRRNIIIGGDWNASMQLDGKNGNTKNANKIFFDRLRDFGLKDCLEPFAEYPVQTHRHNSDTSYPWQLDYIYAADRFANNVTSARVIDNDVVRDASDHNPIEVIFDITT
jgi:exonuclease III